MALVPATITVNFISNYIGPHRVCYRVVGAPTWICTQPGTPGPGFHPNCAGQGNPCSYDIDILVDNETCAQVDYEIYTQAACEDEISTVGRDPVFPGVYNISFIPDPACNRYEVTCDNSPLTNLVLTSGSPSGAGYAPAPGTFPITFVGGGGAGALGTATVDGGGQITGIVLDAPGTGYTSAPVIDLDTPGGGAGATGTVDLLGCTALTIYDCVSGATAEILPLSTFHPGETYDMCGSSEPTVPADYSIVEDGNCLCNCEITDIGNSGPDGVVSYTYIACNGTVISGTLNNGIYLGATCMVAGSLIVTNLTLSAAADITVGAACDAVQ